MAWPVWRERPMIRASCAQLALADVEHELIRAEGNVSAAAKRLSVPTADLRAMTRSVPALMDAAFEAVERGLDHVEQILWQGLQSENIRQRVRAAAFLLRHAAAGQRRGFSRPRGGVAG
jgi:hypothetical protein